MTEINTVNRDRIDFIPFGRRCGCPRPSYVERQQVAARRQAFREANSDYDSILEAVNIPVRFVHITDGAAGQVTHKQRSQQVDVLKNAFAGHRITFSHDENEVVTHSDSTWFHMAHHSAAERAAKAALGIDQESKLNFYTTNGGGLLGWATFPWQLAGDPVMDGVVVVYSSLPGGNNVPYNLGQTGTHEVGHWLGLFHTFQGGCSAVGDHVGDTVAHRGPNYGKPVAGLSHNACNQNELAPIKNFMNYVDDDWMDHFTPQQGARMRQMIGTFRPSLLAVSRAFVGCTRVSRDLR